MLGIPTKTLEQESRFENSRIVEAVTAHRSTCLYLAAGSICPSTRKPSIHPSLSLSSRRDFQTYERSKVGFKHVMGHVNGIPQKCHGFIRKSVTLTSLRVPSGSPPPLQSGSNHSDFTQKQRIALDIFKEGEEEEGRRV